MKKKCFKCGEDKDRTEFYAHPMMGDKLLGKCKECTKADVRKHRVDKPQTISAYERLRFQRPERKKQKATCRRNRQKLKPEKAAAYQAVNRAIKNGTLKRQPCECGEKRVQAHHDDYSKPLDIKWYCFKCHREKGHGQVVVASNDRASYSGQKGKSPCPASPA